MKKETKFTDTYKKKLSSNINEFTKYLNQKTGYEVKINVEFNKELGYVYRLRISLDNFNTYATLIVDSASKSMIMQEVKQNIPNFDFKDKRRLYTSQQNNLISSNIWCCNCDDEKGANNFHRNVDSALLKPHRGYAYICFDCAYTYAAEIFREKDAHTALVFLCSLYDRPYLKKLADDVINMDLMPVEIFGQYFKRINLVDSIKKKKSTFVFSELFDKA